MHKLFTICMLGILCSGCVWLRYLDDKYRVYLSDTVPNAFSENTDVRKTNTVVTIDSIPSKIWSTSIKDHEQTSPDHIVYERAYVEIPRHLDNPQLVVKKPGFEPYIIPLRKKLTDEKWAQYWPNEAHSNPLSAAYLPTFPNTWGLITIKSDSTYTAKDIPTMILAWLALLPLNLTVDVYNLVIGWPLTPVLNPWYNFAYDHTPHILKPTAQMQQACHARPQQLIANSGCESCGTTNVLYSSREECSSCRYREYNPQTKMCKLDWLAYCRNVLKPQHSPKKMGQFLNQLRYHQLWTGREHKMVPVNSNKYMTVDTLIKDCGVDVYETDNDGRSLVFYLQPNYWKYINPKWESHGTPPPMRDKYGMTPRQYYNQQHKSR